MPNHSLEFIFVLQLSTNIKKYVNINIINMVLNFFSIKGNNFLNNKNCISLSEIR